MKKLVILFAAASFMASCGNNNDKAADPGTDASNNAAGTETATPAPAADADVEKGLNLIAGSDCLTCHKVEEKLVGPAYREVAKRYAGQPGAVDTLASKIIHGGAGNWGQMAMSPHPALSKEDAEAMVKYILSLK
jgi:cytochrome c